jgi:hypothetical protein
MFPSYRIRRLNVGSAGEFFLAAYLSDGGVELAVGLDPVLRAVDIALQIAGRAGSAGRRCCGSACLTRRSPAACCSQACNDTLAGQGAFVVRERAEHILVSSGVASIRMGHVDSG